MRYFVTVIFAVLMFAAGTYAQACGQYSIKVLVRDGQNRPVDKALVTVVPITKDETTGKNFARDDNDGSIFVLRLTEGTSFDTFHLIKVTARGFAPAQLQAKFLSCEKREIEARLQKSGSKAKAVWRFENRFAIEAVGAEGNFVKGVGLRIVLVSNGKVVYDESFDGYASLTLPNAVYRFELKHPDMRTESGDIDLSNLEDRFLKVKLARK